MASHDGFLRRRGLLGGDAVDRDRSKPRLESDRHGRPIVDQRAGLELALALTMPKPFLTSFGKGQRWQTPNSSQRRGREESSEFGRSFVGR